MRGPDPAAARVFRELYPSPEPNDPVSLVEYGDHFLVPELRVELDLFYGPLNKNDVQRGNRHPGVDYNDLGWRNRMSKWYYHAELFQVFDRLALRPWEVDQVCTWWGTKAEIKDWVEIHGGTVVGDDIWEGIAEAPYVGPPSAVFHEPGAPVPRRRRSRFSNLIPRPKAIRSIIELHRGSTSSSSSSNESGARLSAGTISNNNTLDSEPPSPEYEEDIVQSSVGARLNRELRTGGTSPAFEEWFKDEYENGHLPSSSDGIASPPQPTSHPFQVSTNTISYRAYPHSSHHAMTMPSYTQRMLSASHGTVPSLPVAVTGTQEVSGRSQSRHSSLGRYQRLPRQYNYRPIRPRPVRNPSR